MPPEAAMVSVPLFELKQLLFVEVVELTVGELVLLTDELTASVQPFASVIKIVYVPAKRLLKFPLGWLVVPLLMLKLYGRSPPEAMMLVVPLLLPQDEGVDVELADN